MIHLPILKCSASLRFANSGSSFWHLPRGVTLPEKASQAVFLSSSLRFPSLSTINILTSSTRKRLYFWQAYPLNWSSLGVGCGVSVSVCGTQDRAATEKTRETNPWIKIQKEAGSSRTSCYGFLLIYWGFLKTYYVTWASPRDAGPDLKVYRSLVSHLLFVAPCHNAFECELITSSLLHLASLSPLPRWHTIHLHGPKHSGPFLFSSVDSTS